MNVTWNRLLVVVLAAALVGGVAGSADAIGKAPDYEVGVAGFSPPNWPEPDGPDWSEFWAEMDELASTMGVHSQWDESGPGVIPGTVAYAYLMGRRPVVVLGLRDVVGDPAKVAALEAMLTELLTQHPVPYLGLGNEIDDVEDFDALADLIEYLASLVRALSPETKLFTVFQYERMLDRGDAAAMVARMPTLDRVGFTVYPFLRYSSTSRIPRRYLDPINEWTSKPIVITETAWPSRQDHPGYPGLHGSEAEQVAYITKLRDQLLPRIDLEVIDWLFVHDVESWHEGQPIENDTGLFSSCGLALNPPGAHKPAYATWRQLHEDSLAAR